MLTRAANRARASHDVDREIRVLRGLDLEVRAGEEIAIVGQSGVGKSTLLHVLGSLETPTAGKVYFEGQDLFALDERATGGVPQSQARLRVPVPLPARRLHRAGERDDAGADRADGRARGRRARGRDARAGRTRRQAASASRRAFRRRAAARRGGARGGACSRAWCWPTNPPAISIRIPPTRFMNCSICSTAELGITLVIATHNERLTRSMGRALQSARTESCSTSRAANERASQGHRRADRRIGFRFTSPELIG